MAHEHPHKAIMATTVVWDKFGIKTFNSGVTSQKLNTQNFQQ